MHQDETCLSTLLSLTHPVFFTVTWFSQDMSNINIFNLECKS